MARGRKWRATLQSTHGKPKRPAPITPAVAGAGRFVSAGERHRETFRCRDIEAHCTAFRHDYYKHRQLGRRFGPLGQSCRFASVMLTIGNPQRRHS
ncbi:hypothetical protein [Burkholderia gladioli]|uniref:hypothetical protein n=1 Tax=Burkholderia gladioli TaxID=28095 RepID=UPI00163F6C40|nr:hypothetical protein [Burkholderia gladioli]